MTDGELAADLAVDLHGSFEALVLAFQDRIYAFALGLCGRPDEAEEIAQDAFIRAYRAMTGYPAARIAELRLSAWLHRIALNVHRNRVRGRRPEQPDLDQIPDSRPGPAEIVEAEMLLRVLPERYRSAVVLRHVQGLSYEEAAEVLGQPAGTVKSHVHRGVELLRRSLSEVEVGHAV